MDFKQIQELIKMINKSNIGELTIEQKDFRITIKQKEEHVTQVVSSVAAAAPVAYAAPQPAAVPSGAPAAAPADKARACRTRCIKPYYHKEPYDWYILS